MSEVESEGIEWFWEPRIPFGTVTVIEGDPDQGKSLLTLDLAARASRGTPFPDGARCSGPLVTLILSAEDHAATTIRPRLFAANADLEQVHILDEVLVEGERVLPEIPRDVELLEEAASELSARLIIIDVINAYLGAEIRAVVDQDIRRAIRPLSKMAERLGAAVVILRHLTKSGGNNPVYRGSGSIGLGGAARSVMLVGELPVQPLHVNVTEPPGIRHGLARVKGNLAVPYPTLAYVIVDAGGAPHLHWLKDPVDVTAHDMLAASETRAHDTTIDEGDEAPEVIFLREELVSGKRKAEDLIQKGSKLGLKYKSLLRARHRLNVITKREGFNPGEWWWWLPGTPTEAAKSTETTAEHPFDSRQNGVDAVDAVVSSYGRNGVSVSTGRCPQCGQAVGADGECPRCTPLPFR